MKTLIIICCIMLSSVLIAQEKVTTESLFMDPSLSLDKEYDFLKFDYLDKVSNFVAPKLEGENFQLSDYVGDLENDAKLKRYYKRYQDDPRKTIIMSFFASYCEPCKEEIPELFEVASDLYAERNDILLVLVGMDGKSDVILNFFEKHSMEVPENCVVLLNPPRNKLSPSSVMKVEKLPSLYVINREGEVILEHLGYRQETNIQNVVDNIVNYYEGIEKYNK